jgi:hypothetical protein
VADLLSRERDPALAPGRRALVSAVDKLIGLDVLPPLVDPLWDTSAAIDDSSGRAASSPHSPVIARVPRCYPCSCWPRTGRRWSRCCGDPTR